MISKSSSIVSLLVALAVSLSASRQIADAIRPQPSLLSAPTKSSAYLSSSRRTIITGNVDTHQNSGPVQFHFRNHADRIAQSTQHALSVRGGSDTEPSADAAPVKLSDIELTPAKILTYSAAALLAAFTIALVKKVPRSGGHAPAPVAEFFTNLGLSELGATGLYHLAYLVHCFVVR